LLLAAGLFAADFEYQSGTAAFGRAKALVLEDRRGNRAAIAQTGFAVTRAVADFVAARLLQSYEIERAGVLLRGTSAAASQPEDLITAIAAALGRLEPAAVRYRDGAMSVAAANGRCIASIAPDASLALDQCAGGDPVRGPIRAAFQMVEPTHGLIERDTRPLSYPVQAIAIGKQVTILGLGGAAPAARFRAKGVIVAPFSNDTLPLPEAPGMDAAIRQVLGRVR
jgi:hypothetical protein